MLRYILTPRTGALALVPLAALVVTVARSAAGDVSGAELAGGGAAGIAAGGGPEGLLGGFLAGVEHPIAGLGHLAVIVAIPILATAWRSGPLAPAGFFVTTLAGCLLVVGGTVMPLAEPGVGLSALLIGGLTLAGARLGTASFVALACLAGLIHGTVYGGSIAGAGASALGGYLIALFLVQVALMGLAWFAACLLLVPARGYAASLDLRAAGAAVACLGMACLAVTA